MKAGNKAPAMAKHGGKAPGVSPTWSHFRWGYLLLASLLAVLFTGVAFTQEPWANPESPPEGWSAWLYPRESNPWLRVAHGKGAGNDSRFEHLVVVGRKVVLTLDNGAITWSDDGGWTWHSSRLPGGEVPAALAFSSERRGYSVSRSGKLHATYDGGTTWSPVSSDHPRWPTGGIRDLALGGDGSFWLLTDLSVWYRGPLGSKWHEEVLALPALVPAGPTDRLSVSRDGSQVWIATAGGALRVARTGDRLTTSGHVPSLITVDPTNVPSAVQGDVNQAAAGKEQGLAPASAFPSRRFQGKRSWWVQGGKAFRLEGERLEPLPLVGAPQQLTDIQFLEDGKRGWVIGEKGWLARTTDGGATWEALQTPRAGDLLQLRMLEDGKTGWLQSREGLWRTDDGGRTLYPQVVRSRALTASLLLEGGTELWAGTSTGALLHSLDGGETWATSGLLDARIVELSQTSQDGQRLLALTVGGAWRSADGGKTWDKPREGSDDRVRASNPLVVVKAERQLSGERGWTIGDELGLLSTRDGGESWTPVDIGTKAVLRSLQMTPDGKRIWLFGDENTLLRSRDGGRTWVPVRNQRSLPRWYFLSWAVVALVGWVGLGRARASLKPEPLETVADLLITDSPIEHPRQDVLGLGALAQGLSNFIRNERTQPPLTVAITGEWGTGKSSVLNLLRTDLCERGFRPVWFNAWHNQQEDNLLAALYSNIISQCVPKLPTLEAIEFRLRLLLRRSARIVFLLSVLLLVLTWAVAFFLRNPEQLDFVTGWVSTVTDKVLGSTTPEAPSAPDAPPVDDMTWPTLLGSLASLGLLARTVLKSLKSFGVDPARLLASVGGSVRLEDSRERVGFQARFAEDFQDVTEALGPRRMVLLIDDLDRCAPQNVVKMLEAINFLVSSGKCFVVMAISRRVIEEYVSQQLGEAADNLSPLVVPVLEGQPAPAEEQARQARRIAFARQYLEKLVNVELPVPQLTQEHAARLTEEHAREAYLPDDTRRRTFQRVGAVLFGTLAFGLAAWLGWGLRVPVPKARDQASAQVSAPAPQEASTPGETKVAEGPAPTEQQASSAPREWSIEDGEAPASRPWSALLWAGVVLALWLARGHALFPRNVVVRDSQPFIDALHIWRPVIMLHHRTPRSIKRFLNRVRFYAMCQRALAAPGGHRKGAHPAAGVIPAFVGWLRAMPVPQSQLPACVEEKEYLLVALAALHDVAPEAIGEPGFYRALREKDSAFWAQPIPSEVYEAWQVHALKFNELVPPKEHLHAFQRLSGSVKMR
ncbi:P-loop NTPase fold protein [Archangium sp.]|uniref:P-loop NTPase fold protein n=1 Tax=Archangium sp. TaxID=1872627 RepID=UPI00286CA062|nr:P-loop NTPase fold protein [Archangium sp.]